MLTPAQIAVLRTNLLAETDPAFVALRQSGATGAMADWYNQNASPAFWVWRTRVMKNEYTNTVSVDGTTFKWTTNGFITRAVGERDAWRELFSHQNACNPSLQNVRDAFLDIFSGTGDAALNRTHLSAVSRRLSTRGERLFATGTGTAATPGTLVFEGLISNDDVVQALAG